MRGWLLVVFSWVSVQYVGDFQAGIVFRMVRRIAAALITCVFALGLTWVGYKRCSTPLAQIFGIGGASIGSITGGIKGQTTETGMLRGVGVGAVAGAITGVQLMELIVTGEPFSKVALICSLVNGKIFMEWVSPAVLKAYQWQISNMETGFRENSDIFEVNTMMDGLSQDAIMDLPTYQLNKSEAGVLHSDTGCAICLQDLNEGESSRLLSNCRHFFHLHCIDEWLTRQGTCPICRKDV